MGWSQLKWGCIYCCYVGTLTVLENMAVPLSEFVVEGAKLKNVIFVVQHEHCSLSLNNDLTVHVHECLLNGWLISCFVRGSFCIYFYSEYWV